MHDPKGKSSDDVEKVGPEDEVYVMQASLYFSEQERKDALMLCKSLRLEKAFQAWTRALGIDVSSEAGKNLLKARTLT